MIICSFVICILVAIYLYIQYVREILLLLYYNLYLSEEGVMAFMDTLKKRYGVMKDPRHPHPLLSF